MEFLVDPEVSKIKFKREVTSLIKHKEELRNRGWLIEATSFPIIRVSFLTRGLQPPVAPLTVDINFTNYNILPPSVRFLNPVTFNITYLNGLQPQADGSFHNVMIQGHPITNEPFICLPGIQEYHSHPQHNGDSWDLHRYTGEGGLYFILDNIWRYCIKSINGYVVPNIVLPQLLLQQEGKI